MSWDKHRAVQHARGHAFTTSHHRCGKYVTEAIRAGGAHIYNTPLAKDMGAHLLAAGFRPVSGSPLEGDVAIIQPIPGHPAGHACIYDGHGTWYSDFKQRTMYPGDGYRTLRPSFQLYRHN